MLVVTRILIGLIGVAVCHKRLRLAVVLLAVGVLPQQLLASARPPVECLAAVIGPVLEHASVGAVTRLHHKLVHQLAGIHIGNTHGTGAVSVEASILRRAIARNGALLKRDDGKAGFGCGAGSGDARNAQAAHDDVALERLDDLVVSDRLGGIEERGRGVGLGLGRSLVGIGGQSGSGHGSGTSQSRTGNKRTTINSRSVHACNPFILGMGEATPQWAVSL